jgi:hypothetical protein
LSIKRGAGVARGIILDGVSAIGKSLS